MYSYNVFVLNEKCLKNNNKSHLIVDAFFHITIVLYDYDYVFVHQRKEGIRRCKPKYFAFDDAIHSTLT